MIYWTSSKNITSKAFACYSMILYYWATSFVYSKLPFKHEAEVIFFNQIIRQIPQKELLFAKNSQILLCLLL